MSKYNRYPFYVLDYDKANMSINKEIIYDGSDLYMNVGDNIVKASDTTVSQIVDRLSNSLYESIDGRYDTVNKMIVDYNKASDKIDNIIDGSEYSESLDYIVSVFNGMEGTSDLLHEINNKARIGFDSGVLSDNDFTNELLDILDSAEFGAEKYIHPSSKQCNYISPVQSVFGRMGDVVVTKEDFGLGSIDPNANNYIHPRGLQCKPKYVTSINGMTSRDIKITKGTIGLGIVENKYATRGVDDLINKTDDMYLIFNTVTDEYIKKRVGEINEIPDVDSNHSLSISIISDPSIDENPMYSMTSVTVYKRSLDISRKYEINPVHEFNMRTGKYIVRVEGYSGNNHIVRTRHINIHKDMDIEIDIREDDLDD